MNLRVDLAPIVTFHHCYPLVFHRIYYWINVYYYFYFDNIKHHGVMEMKNTIITILGVFLFGVASMSFACEGCHGPSKQINIPEADNFQSILNIPHPISIPSLQLSAEQTQLSVKQKQVTK